jgi:predicted ArsR family transcriptional regulator
MLNAVLREVRETLGPAALSSVIDGIGKRAASKVRERVVSGDPKARALEVASYLREQGVEAEVIQVGDSVELREHNCPYAKTVAEHPEVCSIIHTVLRETVSPNSTQVESLATGGDACRFEIKAS